LRGGHRVPIIGDETKESHGARAIYMAAQSGWAIASEGERGGQGTEERGLKPKHPLKEEAVGKEKGGKSTASPGPKGRGTTDLPN